MNGADPPGPPAKPVRFIAAQRRRFLLLAVLRPVLTVIVLVVVYYLLPVDRRLDIWTLVALIAGLTLVVAVVVWQVWRIMRSPDPLLQGVQALTVIVALFLLIFANAYYLLEFNRGLSFTEPLTRTDALYFAITVFATVGFGDIAPTTETARVLVTAQMLGDLLILGVVLRIILTAVQRGRSRE